MNDFLLYVWDFMKKFSPYIIGGVIGSIIHRLRTDMSFVTFLKTLGLSVFVSICAGIVCKDYFNVANENVIFVCCGISGAFSKYILDEIEQIIKLGSVWVKSKIGITKNN